MDKQDQIEMTPLEYTKISSRVQLEDLLENIVSGASFVADTTGTREDHKDKILNECNNVRRALQDLLVEFEENVWFYSQLY